MSDSEQQPLQESERVDEAQWPENGDSWSEAEDEAGMDCELLQAMAEEDEDINVFNEETFGMDIDPDGTAGSVDDGVSFGEALPPTPPPVPPPLPSCPGAPPSPPRLRPQYLPRSAPWQRGRGPRWRGGLGRGQMFDDPAVMRIVEGRPSLMSLDSSIVDCGHAVYRKISVEDRLRLAYWKNQRVSGSILEDSAIMCVIGHRGRGQHMNSDFLEPQYPVSSYGVRRGEPRGSYSRRLFGQRGPSQMHAPMMPGSPIFSRQPLTSRQQFNQTGGFRFPTNPSYTSTPRLLTPRTTQLRFGGDSPTPSHFYNPSTNPVPPFSYRGPVTQLHPQHKRLLSQKHHLFQRKPEGWDPYCNLMTAKEKEWITRLLMIPLQSENPYLDDYYYQEYYRRLEAKMAEEELGIRSKKEPPKLTTPYISKADAYTPVVHIEGSLGQVAVSTCYSPRRAISAVHAVQTPCPLQEQKDTRQQRLEILSKIEKLFVVLLEVEEAERRAATVLSEVEERRLKEKNQRNVDHIYSQLQHHNSVDSEEEFLPFLSVSKGKQLLARLLPFLKNDLALKILHIVASNLPTLISRDAEETLPVLYPSLRNVISGLTFSQLINVLKDLTSSESLSTYECLSLTCDNKFGLTLLYALLSHGEKLLSSGVPLDPSIGDFETWTDVIFLVAGQLSQCSLVEPLCLPSNLLTLFCRYLDKRTVHQLKSNLESASGGLALPS